MAYNKHVWKAREGTGLNKYTDQSGKVYEFTPTPDEVTEPGTPFSARWMNEMEDGIAAAGIIYGVCRTAESVSEKTVDTGGAPERLATGDHFRITFENAVQAGAALNINSLGAYPIIDNYTGEAIVLGDISAGYIGDIMYEDGRFVLLNAVRPIATPQGATIFTENTIFVVPLGINSIRVSACAAGVKNNAGEWIENQIYNVTQGQKIPLTIGAGNTIIGDLVTLVAGSYAGSSPSTKLGYATGYSGGAAGSTTYPTGGGVGGYGGRYGFGGGGGGGLVQSSEEPFYTSGGGGGAGIGGAGGRGGSSSSTSNAGSGGGETGGAGTKSSKYTSQDQGKGGDATRGTIIYPGAAATYNGGGGSIYGAGGGAGCRNNASNGIRMAGGGGAGGYGAGGGQSGANVSDRSYVSTSSEYGTPSNGMVLIEWGFTLS